MANNPGLSEIATTTRRNRSALDKGKPMAKKAMPSKAALAAFEHTKEDKMKDKREAAKRKIPVSEYENSPADRRADIRAVIKKAVSEHKKGGKK